MNYEIHKFGGSSLANANCFKHITNLLSGKHEIIVASAIYGVTTQLQKILDAAKNNVSYVNLFNDLEALHESIAHDLLENNATMLASIKNDIEEIKSCLAPVKLTGSYSKEIQHFVLGYGEIWSSQILAAYLANMNNILYLNPTDFLFVFEKNGMLFVDWEKSKAALTKILADKKFDQLIVPGFIASTLEGKRTTLGRNGSDFSAAIMAKLCNARSLTIWTDVDGIYTADPNKVRSAFVIDALSYNEALELANFGAKVLHPMTVGPAYEANIPIFVKNSANPAANGTCISANSSPSKRLIKGVTSIDDIALINVEGVGMIGVPGIATRIFKILEQQNISLILIAQSSSEHSICFAIANKEAERAKSALEENLKFEIDKQQIEKISLKNTCSILSVFGDGMNGKVGILNKLTYSLAAANINILAISQGASERNISVVVDNRDINKALSAAHAGFYLSAETVSVGIIGPGLVGSSLLKQIQNAITELKTNTHANLLIRGIMNSKSMLLSHENLVLSNWQEQLARSEKAANIDAFVKHIRADDIPHAVIIDCTANVNVAKMYSAFMKKNIHVITPNKHANSGDLIYYKEIKALSSSESVHFNRSTQEERGYKTSPCHYLYEATVCAGLPIITTLQDLIKTGDKIEKIEGIVSGTLSYIFNELTKNRKFSEIVYEAKQRGYTEPDPREDLSGMDVARKLVCLAREIGFAANLSDVKVYDLIPAELKAGSAEDFLANLSICDEAMQKLVAKAKFANEQIRYVGTINSDGTVNVALKSFPQSHPFARLNGTDNMLIFHTKRYKEQPLVIQGPGAGAEVTAAGIFSDLLRLVSYL